MNIRKLFLTFFYSGLSPKAPGTAGTIAGAALGWVILQFLPVATLFLLTLLITIAGIKEIDKYEKESGEHDNGWIVIDEVAGIWLAFCLIPQTPVAMVLAVIFFRILDILKPSIIGKIDKNVKGGKGVMGDDLVAGLFAGILSSLCHKIFSII